MMDFQLGRVKLLAQTQVSVEPVFDVAFIGHTDKLAKLSVFFENTALLDDLRLLGYAEFISDLFKKHQAGQTSDAFFNIPIPLRSYAEFTQLFCVDSNFDLTQRYQTLLTETKVWLPSAIADFFQAEVMNVARRLWIIPVNETEYETAFLSADVATLPSEIENNALLRALSIPKLAYLAMPDLERLLIPQNITPVPLFAFSQSHAAIFAKQHQFG